MVSLSLLIAMRPPAANAITLTPFSSPCLIPACHYFDAQR
jgi:hypothetical protein